MLVDNHTYIRHIMLDHFEKGWKAAQSFRDLELLAKENPCIDFRWSFLRQKVCWDRELTERMKALLSILSRSGKAWYDEYEYDYWQTFL